MHNPEQTGVAETDQTGLRTELNKIITRLPEVMADREAVLSVANELSEQFQLKPEFFQDSLRNFFLVALAQRLAKTRASEYLSPQQRITEEYFINLALPLLATDMSAKFEAFKGEIDTEIQLPTDQEEAIYDKYTNKELTEKLAAAINSGLLAEVQQRLDLQTVQSYELRVLQVGDIYTSNGMEPRRPDEEYSTPPSEAWQKYDHDYAIFSEQLTKLTDNAANFMKDKGMHTDMLPAAWITRVGDKTLLCIPETIAEKILEPGRFDTEIYDDRQRQKDFATLEHEFVHTQNSLLLDGQPYFGIAFEERRAEYFSGDKMGYLDVKGMLMDIEIVTGFDFKAWFEEHKSGDRTMAYVELANALGTQAALELALSVPDPYLKEHRKYQHRIAQYLGSPDNLVERLYNQAIADGQEGGIEERINMLVETWKSRGIDFELMGEARPAYLGLEFMTKKYLESYNRSLNIAADSATTRQ